MHEKVTQCAKALTGVHVLVALFTSSFPSCLQANAVTEEQAKPMRPVLRQMLVDLQKDYAAMLYGGQVGWLL
jgi:hypothetical protein